jgi:hypothetical protein
MFTAAVVTKQSSRNNPDVIKLMNGSKKCCTYTQWSITQPQRMMTWGFEDK